MTVGSELGAARKAMGLSLADVASQTRVRASLLAAIEADDFEACGGAVYARGHIRSFAAVVGLEPAPLIADFDGHHETVPVPVLADALPARSLQGIHEKSRPNWLAYGVGATAALTIALTATYFLQGSAKPDHTLDAGKAPATTATAHAKAATGAPTAAAVVPTHPAPPVVAQLAPVDVELKITKASWVQETDGQNAFATTLMPGATKIFTSQTGVKLTLGNAGGVDVTVNGKHIGLLGKDGAVLNNVTFGPTGITAKG